MSDDPHAPTTAAPTPESSSPPASPSSPSAAQAAVAKATAVRDSVLGAASSANEAPADRPEILAGAAFAGGLVAALVLKRLTR